MSASEIRIRVRPMVYNDIDAIFAIDHLIRSSGESPTYADLTTEQLFGMERGKHATISQIAEATDLGFIAEFEGKVRGFIVGRQPRISQRATEMAEIAILGVHPDYQRMGIATKLVDTVCEELRSRGIREVRIGIDPHDKDLLAFFESIEFVGEHLLNYTKTL